MFQLGLGCITWTCFLLIQKVAHECHQNWAQGEGLWWTMCMGIEHCFIYFPVKDSSMQLAFFLQVLILGELFAGILVVKTPTPCANWFIISRYKLTSQTEIPWFLSPEHLCVQFVPVRCNNLSICCCFLGGLITWHEGVRPRRVFRKWWCAIILGKLWRFQTAGFVTPNW